MMGLVIFNNLLSIYLVWEIIIVTSFVLIGYAGTAGALRAAFHYLTWSLVRRTGTDCRDPDLRTGVWNAGIEMLK